MEQKKAQELNIEISPEVAAGKYANFAVISHGPTEMFLDFIAVAPNMPRATVQSRIVMNPAHAKNLLFALTDNIRKYEAEFGEIKLPQPRRHEPNGGTGGIPNPFVGSGQA